MRDVILINGRSYNPSDISVQIAGVNIFGITSLSYIQKQEKTPMYEIGSRATAIMYGKTTYEGKMTLYLEDVIALRKKSPKGNLTSIPFFEIVVAIFDENNRAVIDTLYKCQFLEDASSFNAGDMSILVDVPFFIGRIAWSDFIEPLPKRKTNLTPLTRTSLN